MNISPSKAPRILAVVFAIMAILFLARGLTQALPSSSAAQAKDLHINWTELRLVIHHHSPYDLKYTDHPSPYPAYAFIPNLVLYWPPWSVCRLYFVLLTLICLAGIAGWGYRCMMLVDRNWAITMGMAVLAVSSISTCMGLGQNAIIFTALLVATLVLSERGQPVAAGLLLGVALSKPNLALPFLLPIMFRGGWKIILVAAAFIIAFTAALCLWVHSSPFAMIPPWIHAAEQNAGVGYDFSSLMTIWGANAVTATRVSEALVLPAAVLVFFWLRDLPLRPLFGMAAGFARLWTYHRVYDNFILVILMVPLAEAAFRTRRASTFIALALLGLTLWFPIHSIDVPPTHIVHLLIWMGAMAALGRDAISIYRRGQAGPSLLKETEDNQTGVAAR